jgi:hypothetical protein
MRRSVRSRVWATVLLVGVAGLPAGAWGSDSAPATAAEREAQSRFEEGLARVKATNFEGARMSFTQAYAVLRKPAILWNLALSEERTGHPLDALAHFKSFAGVAATSDDRVAVDRHIADLRAQLGHLDVSAAMGAQIFVDGSPTGVAPWSEPLDLAPGHHHVQARTPQDLQEGDVDVGAGLTVKLALTPPAPAAPTGARPSSAAPSIPAAGDGPNDRERAAPARGEPSLARVLTVVGVGTLAALSVAVGAYFALQSQAERNTADRFRGLYPSDYCFGMSATSVCTQWNGAVTAQNRDATFSNGLYIGAGVLAAGALATWLFWPPSSRAAQAWRVAPSIGVEGAGFAAARTF